jgi:hypothetical protein
MATSEASKTLNASHLNSRNPTDARINAAFQL